MAARKIDDAGEVVTGARKHDWGHGLRVEHLSAMSAEEAHEAAVKDAVWPQPDYAAMIAGGASAEAAALVKIVRDRISAKPSPKAAEQYGQQDVRTAYVSLVSRLRELAEAAKTVEDVKAIYRAAYDFVGYGERGYAQREPVMRLRSVRTGNSDPFEIKPADLTKARGMVADGFPELRTVAAWLKGVTFRSRASGEVYAIKRGQILPGEYPDRAAAEAGIERAWLEEQERKASEPKAPPVSRETPEDACRQGMSDHRGGRDVTPEEFIDTFGFRGVQFGQSMPDVERQLVLNRSFDSLHDLAEVLDMPLKAVSLNGFLAAALGARGRNAAAHYEGVHRIYNLGRKNGAGCLAHEWAHALDHYCAEMSADTASEGAVRYMSEGAFGARLPEGLVSSWTDLMRLLQKQPRTKEDAVAAVEALIEGQRAQVVEQDKAFEAFLASGRKNDAYVRRVAKWKGDVQRYIAAQETRKTKLVEAADGADFGSKPTGFLADATAISGSGDYMRRPWELVARSFESYVFDRIAERGGRSDFLVCAVEEDRYADRLLWKGNPYPEGEERVAFNAAYDRLAAEFRSFVAPENAPAPAPGS